MTPFVPTRVSLGRISQSRQRGRDLVEYDRVFNGRRHFPFLSVRNLDHGGPKDLAGSRFRETVNDSSLLERRDRSDSSSDGGNTFADDLVFRSLASGVQAQEPQWKLSFQLVVNPNDRAFCNIWVVGENLFHLTRRQAMPGDVDDIIGPGHDIAITVFILDPASPVS